MIQIEDPSRTFSFSSAHRQVGLLKVRRLIPESSDFLNKHQPKMRYQQSFSCVIDSGPSWT